ncbi:hypothetical protein [Clostridium sp. CCUG 7971]|uniref:hypothetical protein n=1 Tax=Clostridium sp. CCUG 7971 TaxID=2811414 RepID=UPI001ABB14E2|nr:hypothetical protein [Clostridium sp. CCUG 7971]MBO3445275.1 hypothetical protein [Clostridium sp. CCUG 7971]
MIYLINIEFKKIIKSRITIITLSLSILLIISYVAITTLGERYKYSDNVEYKGLEAIHLDKEVQLQLKGILTEEKISQIIGKYNEITNNSSNVDQSNNLTPKAYFKYWKKYSIIESLISRSYGSILSSNIDAIKELAPSDGNRFYTNKYKQTKEYINNPNLSLNNKEKNIVLDELSKLDIPLKYNYNAGWTNYYGI